MSATKVSVFCFRTWDDCFHSSWDNAFPNTRHFISTWTFGWSKPQSRCPWERHDQQMPPTGAATLSPKGKCIPLCLKTPARFCSSFYLLGFVMFASVWKFSAQMKSRASLGGPDHPCPLPHTCVFVSSPCQLEVYLTKWVSRWVLSCLPAVCVFTSVSDSCKYFHLMLYLIFFLSRFATSVQKLIVQTWLFHQIIWISDGKLFVPLTKCPSWGEVALRPYLEGRNLLFAFFAVSSIPATVSFESFQVLFMFALNQLAWRRLMKISASLYTWYFSHVVRHCFPQIVYSTGSPCFFWQNWTEMPEFRILFHCTLSCILQIFKMTFMTN